MPIEFTELTKTEQPMKEASPEDSAIIQKRTSVLMGEVQQVMERVNAIDSRVIAQDFSICIGWGRVKLCLTIE